MQLYSIDEAFPAELVRSFEGLPCRTRSKTCGMRLEALRAGVLSSIRVEGRATCVVEYLPPNGGIWSINGMFDEPLHVVVSPSSSHTVEKNKDSFVSVWRGALKVDAGTTCHIKLECPDAPSTTVGQHRTNYCTIEVRDVSIGFRAAGTSLGSQIAALFDDSAALSAHDAIAVRFKDPSSPRLYVSKFVLQLRSPVFKAELDGPYQEAHAQEICFDDFPPAAVRCFLEMLHKDAYSGPRLSIEELIAVYALGDKYDVLFVQDAVKNELEDRELVPKERRMAFAALRRYRATALEPLLVKKIRCLDHHALAQVVCG